MNRRNFLKYIAASSLVLASPHSIKDGLENRVTEANHYLRTFPESINGAANIKKYETSGAKYCLVHIRQKHMIYGECEGTDFINQQLQKTRKGMDEMNAHQEAIYNILCELKNREIIGSVYLEGFSEKSYKETISEGPEFLGIPSNEKLEEEIDSMKRELTSIPFDLPTGMTKQQYIEKRKEAIREKEMQLAQFQYKYRFLNGGALRAVYERILTPRFEDETALENALAYKRKKTKEDVKVIQDDREDALLKIIAGEDSPIAVISFGGNHAFAGKVSFTDYFYDDRMHFNKDNIAEWNRKHPDQKFSLIEIIPVGYETCLRRQK